MSPPSENFSCLLKIRCSAPRGRGSRVPLLRSSMTLTIAPPPPWGGGCHPTIPHAPRGAGCHRYLQNKTKTNTYTRHTDTRACEYINKRDKDKCRQLRRCRSKKNEASAEQNKFFEAQGAKLIDWGPHDPTAKAPFAQKNQATNWPGSPPPPGGSDATPTRQNSNPTVSP